ncbi:MAG: lipid-A-disaccharide synthase, partial [Prevotella sp.]|nr:lipid-A-disaccharide synthase [Prevotella sp.]
FEVDFYEKRHHYPIHYVGNPTAEEVHNFQSEYKETREEFLGRHDFDDRPIIALLAGSRKQEIKDNLPAMIEAAKRFSDYQLILACAPAVEDIYYDKFIKGTRIRTVTDETYQLLTHSTAALVTSGTATLETALFNVPQVVCYETPVPKLIRFAFNHIIKVDYISLVNLIADREVVPELLADRFKVYNIANELYNILPGHPGREKMLDGYKLVANRLGTEVAPENAAKIMYEMLWK